MNDAIPHVSVIMPSYNEEKFIEKSIKSLIDDYLIKNCELLVVDGMSNDDTQGIVQSFIKKGFRVKLFENEKRTQAYGLNLGISKAKGAIIIRADAHCIYPPGYIKKCVELLEKTEASNVGGIMFPQGNTTLQKSIAISMQNPVGVGNAKFHLGNYSGFVDTVYLGTFRKKLFDEIGLFDPKCYANEDAELNLRILKAGKKIYLDSTIKVVYFPRESLKELAVQYFKYGKGRCYTTLKHKRFTSFRQIGPIILVIGLSLSIILSIWNPFFLAFPFIYFLTLLFAAIFSYSKRPISLKQRILMGFVFLVMHVSWGTGFLSRLLFPEKSL